MAVKIRMKMFGRTNRPEFRIVAADTRSPRDGRIVENLGWYHPRETKPERILSLNEDRIKYWLSVGAQPSETLISIFKKRGIVTPWTATEKKKREKKIAERRTAKGKTGEKKPRAAKPAKAAAAAPAGGEATTEKAKAAESKAAKREAKKAK